MKVIWPYFVYDYKNDGMFLKFLYASVYSFIQWNPNIEPIIFCNVKLKTSLPAKVHVFDFEKYKRELFGAGPFIGRYCWMIAKFAALLEFKDECLCVDADTLCVKELGEDWKKEDFQMFSNETHLWNAKFGGVYKQMLEDAGNVILGNSGGSDKKMFNAGVYYMRNPQLAPLLWKLVKYYISRMHYYNHPIAAHWWDQWVCNIFRQCLGFNSEFSAMNGHLVGPVRLGIEDGKFVDYNNPEVRILHFAAGGKNHIRNIHHLIKSQS